MSVHPVGAQSPGGCWAIAGGATSWCCPPPSLTLSSGGGDCDPAWRVKVRSGALFYSPTLIVSNFPTLLLSYYPTLLLSPNQATVAATGLPAGGKFAISGSEPRPTLPCITPYIFHTKCISQSIIHKVHYVGPCIFHNALPSTGWYTPLCKLF